MGSEIYDPAAVAREKRSQINLRLSPEEAKAFKRAAGEAGMTLSAWLRYVARKHAGLPTVE